MQIILRSSELGQSQTGHTVWHSHLEEIEVEANQCAVLACDVWDGHWCRGARERLAELVPKMDAILRAARKQGMSIVHAPSDTIDFYGDSPARNRILEMPLTDPPSELLLPDPPLPIYDSDHGSDTGETEPSKEWHRQHAGIYIDEWPRCHFG